MRPEDYLRGLLAERDNSVRAGNKDHVKLVDREIASTRALLREAERAVATPDVETR